jgi:hypothetical protein
MLVIGDEGDRVVICGDAVRLDLGKSADLLWFLHGCWWEVQPPPSPLPPRPGSLRGRRQRARGPLGGDRADLDQPILSSVLRLGDPEVAHLVLFALAQADRSRFSYVPKVRHLHLPINLQVGKHRRELKCSCTKV